MSKLDDLLSSLKRLAGVTRPETKPTEPPTSVAVAEPEPIAEAAIALEPEPVAPEPAPSVAVPELAAEPEPEPIVAEALPIEEPPAPAQPLPASSASGGVLLRLESERDGTPTFDVARSGATIGRGPENTIRLADLSVSRKHAKITYRQSAYWLSDLGSMGGTWVDGTKLAAPRRIETGQVIDIGVCRMTVADAPSGEEAPVESGTARRRR